MSLPAISAGKEPLRVVVAAHGHPQVSKGGAEIAAYQLFQSLAEGGDCQTWFIGCDPGGKVVQPGSVISQPMTSSEYLYGGGGFDHFKFANRDHRFPAEFVQLFVQLCPQIAHFHHYTNLGVEAFQHVKRAVPECKLVLTLHEYLAICHNFGQMLTNPHHSLCNRSSPVRCHQCFPQFDRSDFFLRELYIKRFFDLIDHFIAPSHFLAERYATWGIPQDKMTVIENIVTPIVDGLDSRPAWPASPLRLGYFGQISSLKGIDVIFDTAELLLEEPNREVEFDIYGEYRNQPIEFQGVFLERLAKIGRNVRYCGPYEESQVDELMRSVHAILVPSVWWENSPLVIQEALRNRRPIICSDIGGMAEKVRNGIDGFHFPVGSVVGLASLVRRLASEPEILARLSENMSPPVSYETTVAAHLELYRRELAL